MKDRETENALIVIQYLKQLFVIIGGVSLIKIIGTAISLLVTFIF
tara:strand:- start:2860 stop:2994 length:135 start_codon:yes stop_codon:yes gene_type:complete